MSVAKRIAVAAGALLALGLLSAIGALAFLAIQRSQPFPLPAPTGPYGVGRVEYDWVDEARSETLAQGQNGKRELVVWVWYPTAPDPETGPADYLPGAWGEARERDLGLQALLVHSTASVRVHAVAGAALAPGRPSYPVLIMEPGLGPAAPDYTVLAEELASHGYVVAGATPTYSANLVVFPDGRVARSTGLGNPPETMSAEASERVLGQLISVWAADDVFVLDQLQALNAGDPSGRFSRRLDLGAVGVFGHSFGGAAAAEACRMDARFKAGADIDGTPFGDVIQVGLSQPFMFILSEHPRAADPASQQMDRSIQAIYSGLSHGGYRLTIQGARHMNFSDYAVRYDSLAGLILRRMGALGPIDPRRGLAVTADYLRAFFDRYLIGSDEPLLQGPSASYPEVQFESR